MSSRTAGIPDSPRADVFLQEAEELENETPAMSADQNVMQSDFFQDENSADIGFQDENSADIGFQDEFHTMLPMDTISHYTPAMTADDNVKIFHTLLPMATNSHYTPEMSADENAVESELSSDTDDENSSSIQDEFHSSLQEVCDTSVAPDPKTASETNRTEEEASEEINCEADEEQQPSKVSTKRKNYCIFCEKLVTNFTVHLQRRLPCHNEIHFKKELESPEIKEDRKEVIASVLELFPLIDEYRTSSSSTRKLQISTMLRGKGNFAFNEAQLNADKEKFMLPARRLTSNSRNTSVSADKFVPCKFCKNLYQGKTLYRHQKNCKVVTCVPVDPAFKALKKKRRVLQDHRNAVGNTINEYRGSGASDMLKKEVFPIFQNDAISLAAKNDKLICLFGSEIVKNHLDHHQLRTVAGRMRDLARLLIDLRVEEPAIKKLSDALTTSNFKHLITSTQRLSGYNTSTGTVKVVTLPGRIQTSLKLCLQLNLCDVIENSEIPETEKLTYQNNVTLMRTLFESRWSFNVSSQAEKTRKKNETTKKQIMPLNSDIKIITKYLEDRELEHYSELQLGNDLMRNFDELCKVLIALIILYNRRRAGEAARIEMQYYLNKDTDPVNEEIVKTLSEAQQTSARTLTSFNIPGKRTRCVPVLLTKQMKRSIDLIIELRDKVHISEDNKFLFAKSYSLNPYDGTKIIRDFRNKLKLNKPCDLTSTGLRHNIATMSGVCNFDGTKKAKLARTLGHDLAVHERRYNLTQKETERGEIGEFLVAAAHGKLFEKHPPTCTTSPDISNAPTSKVSSKKENITFEEEHKESCSTVSNDEHGDKPSCEAFDEDEEHDVDHSHLSDNSGNCHEDSDDSISFTRKKRGKISSSSSEESLQTAPSISSKKKMRRVSLSEENKKKVATRRRWSSEEKRAILRNLQDCIDERVNPKQLRSQRCIDNEPVLQQNNRTWTMVNGLINNFLNGKYRPDFFTNLD